MTHQCSGQSENKTKSPILSRQGISDKKENLGNIFNFYRIHSEESHSWLVLIMFYSWLGIDSSMNQPIGKQHTTT